MPTRATQPRHGSAAALFLVCLGLTGVLSPWGATGAESGRRDGPPASPEIMPLDAVAPGMKVVAYTVFQGTTIEPVHGTVVGIGRNYLGPQRHIVLVMFEGDRIRHTGIAHGMSGSPVYADGRLVGAVSLALGPFQKDPLAGVTPIEFMLSDADGSAGDGASPAAGTATRRPFTDEAGVLSTTAASPKVSLLRPLEAPLAVFGIDPSVLGWFAGAFSWAGPVTFPGGTGSTPAPRARNPAGARAGAPVGSGAAGGLEPGSPVAGLLVYGDAVLAATGTVTYVEGDQVLAFGHRFMQLGTVAIPMATAEIVATVADQTYPYKLANPGRIVGTMTRDRPAGVAGRVGAAPDTLPMTITVRRGDQVTTHYTFHVADLLELTPTLVQLLLANALRSQWQFENEGTYQVSAHARLRGGVDIPFQQVFPVTSSTPEGVALVDVARAVTRPFSILYRNRFGKVDFDALDVEISVGDAVRLYRIADLRSHRRYVRPGEPLKVRLRLDPYRGDPVYREVVVPIPSNLTSRDVWIQAVDGPTADRPGAPAGRMPVEQAKSLEQLVGLLAQARRSDRCYIQLVTRRPGVVVQSQRLSSLPATAAAVLEASEPSSAAASIEEAVLWEHAIDFDGVVVGGWKRQVPVRPPF